ncbi:MAG: alpha/beta hydrolase [Candidatus Hydrogenedentes bacterium]|nr:alpha/beta hydrolase [Candidatus Hydrogenedentota bacterium]
MNIERFGNGPHVYVGIHGWAGNHRTFAPLVPYLPVNAAFYCVDLPGYGKSPAPNGEWNIDSIATQLAEQVAQLHGRPVTLVGYCGGGNLAILTAAQLEHGIGRLVLIDPFAYMPLYFRIFTWGEFGRHAYTTTFASPMGRWFTNAALRKKRSGKTSLTQAFEKVDHELTLRAIRGFARFPSYTTFRDLHIPVDLAYGAHSFKAVKRSAELWRNVWPHARLHELIGAGHSPIVEATAQLSKIVFDVNA